MQKRLGSSELLLCFLSGLVASVLFSQFEIFFQTARHDKRDFKTNCKFDGAEVGPRPKHTDDLSHVFELLDALKAVSRHSPGQASLALVHKALTTNNGNAFLSAFAAAMEEYTRSNHSHDHMIHNKYDDHHSHVQQKDVYDDICKGQLFYVQMPVACVAGKVKALISVSQNVTITPNALMGSWSEAIAMVFVRSQYSSPFASEFGFVKKLQVLYLEEAISGDIPSELMTLTNLKYLNIHGEALTGTIDPSIFQLTALNVLVLFGSSLTGSIPDSLCLLTNLRELNMGSNRQSSTIPTCIGNMGALKLVGLDANNQFGVIPSQIGRLSLLMQLNLENNLFSGLIPSELGNLGHLTMLILYFNQLSGTIPTQLALMKSLQTLHLQSNMLVGTLPSEFATISNILEINVSNNELHGTIPREILENKNITIGCNFSGLDHPLCSRNCPRCKAFHFATSKCDSQGQGQRCVSVFLVLLIVPTFVGLTGFALTRFVPRNRLTHQQHIQEVIMSTFAFVDVATDISFSINLASRKQSYGLFVASVCVMVCFSVANMLACIMIISRVALDIGVDGTYQNQDFRARVFNKPFVLVLAVVYCTFNLRAIPFIVSEYASNSSHGNTTTNSNSNSNTHNNTTNSSNNNSAATVNNNSVYNTTRLRSFVGLVTVLLEDIPQFILQVIAFASGQKTFTVLVSLCFTVLSVVMECVSLVIHRIILLDESNRTKHIFTPISNARKQTLIAKVHSSFVRLRPSLVTTSSPRRGSDVPVNLTTSSANQRPDTLCVNNNKKYDDHDYVNSNGAGDLKGRAICVFADTDSDQAIPSSANEITYGDDVDSMNLDTLNDTWDGDDVAVLLIEKPHALQQGVVHADEQGIEMGMLSKHNESLSI